MKLLCVILSLSVLKVSLSFAQEKSATDRIHETLDEAINDKLFAGGVIGVSVGEEVVTISGGLKNVKEKLAFDNETICRIASISKPMTAVAVLQLYEQGRIDLDEPIATYLPDYPKRHASRITTGQLLLHSSGIGGYKSGKEAQNKKQYNSLAEAATVFQDRDLIEEPGKAENYTTYGYVVLGMIIESVSGQSYEDYMKDHIWDVVGMTHTRVEHLDKKYSNKSKFYHRTKKGKIKESKTNNLSNRIPGGGIQSTVEDLLKFGNAVLDHTLISESTFKMMMSKPGLPYEGNPYGMGWFIYGDNPMVGHIYGHTGEQTGSSAVLFIMPEKDAVIVVLTNTALALNSVFGLGMKMFPVVEELYQFNG